MPRLEGESQEQFLNRTTYQSGGRPYRTYVALLTQSGSNAPNATVLENTFPITPTWVRASTGIYNLNLSGSFPVSGTFCSATLHSIPKGVERVALFGAVTNHQCRLRVYGSGSNMAVRDNFDKFMSVEVRSYGTGT